MNDELQCSVCGSTDNVTVCCSRVGPVSYAYCSVCHEHGYMGHAEAIGLLFCVSYDQLRSDLQNLLVMSHGKIRRMKEWAHSEEVVKELNELSELYAAETANYEEVKGNE